MCLAGRVSAILPSVVSRTSEFQLCHAYLRPRSLTSYGS